ncbi:MAG: 3-methyladenine DNA glycosylase [Actinobacteria bacterium HGW-Actinobacteria-7]|nr:MAG: 3-methyladenine DNA glycosylase [Actinobacteria bacterium HGW-Actinobacteria-7]
MSTDGSDLAGARPLPLSFYERDPRDVARDLLGCVLRSTAGDVVTAGRIVETEAYLGADDLGSHAATKGITARNAVMYGPPMRSYVYFTYGNHHMFNVVCESEGVAGAVLVRAIEPLVGIDVMTRRRSGRGIRELCNGPGKLTAALGIDLADNGTTLGEGNLQVYAGTRRAAGGIATSGRIGLSQGHELPFRFYFESNTFVSRGRTGAPCPRATLSEKGRA